MISAELINNDGGSTFFLVGTGTTGTGRFIN